LRIFLRFGSGSPPVAGEDPVELIGSVDMFGVPRIHPRCDVIDSMAIKEAKQGSYNE
jgi:hypothetical protein